MLTAKDPGREQELIRLMDEYGGMLMNLCAVTLRDASLAQDAVQETFIKAYRYMETTSMIHSERAWLIRIAVNTCRDMMRTAWFRHVDRKTTLDQLPEAIAPQTQDSDILQNVRSLPVKERQVILLYYWQSMSAEEVGTALGIDRATVYRRLERGRKKLKLMLTEEGGAAYDRA